MLNKDYRDMLQALADEKVEFLLVGAYALAAHGHPRATMDIDIWVMPSPNNAEALEELTSSEQLGRQISSESAPSPPPSELSP